MVSTGVGAIWAKIGSTAKPKVTITVEGDKWTMKSETLVKSSCIEFTLGQEFDETTADDRKMKVRRNIILYVVDVYALGK